MTGGGRKQVCQATMRGTQVIHGHGGAAQQSGAKNDIMTDRL
jgi:hypothetical protein